MANKQMIDAMWDDSPVDVSTEVNFIWSIANKLRGPYRSDKYKDVNTGLQEKVCAQYLYNQLSWCYLVLISVSMKMFGNMTYGGIANLRAHTTSTPHLK